MKITWPIGPLLLLTLSGCPQGSPSTSVSNTPAVTGPAGTAPVASPTVATVAEDFVIVAGQRFGPITADSTQATLEQQFGKDQVKAGNIPGAEGIMLPGLQIFADQPDKMVSVFLTETEPKQVSHVQISGEASQWKTAQGVSLGTSLAELETLNGKPFELMGFGWDYGGHVTDWKGGALEGMNLRLDVSSSDLTEEESASISGDKTIATDSPTVRKANPRVSQITLIFSAPDASPTESASPITP